MGEFARRMIENGRMSRNVVDLTRDPFVNMLRAMQAPVGGWGGFGGREVNPYTGELILDGYPDHVLYQARDPMPVVDWPMPYTTSYGWERDPVSGKMVDAVWPPVTPHSNPAFQRTGRSLTEAFPPQPLSHHPQPGGFSRAALKHLSK